MSPRSSLPSAGEPASEPPVQSGEIAAIFDGMLRHARELLAVRSPLDAELIVSEILGSWWGQRAVDGDVEEVVGEALVAHSGRVGSPAALALLTGVTCLGTRGQAARAERAALELMDLGVARPIWSDRVGMVEPRECYVSRDVYGDQESVICVFEYPRGDGGASDRHALVVLVDRARPGVVGTRLPGERPPACGTLRDAWVSSRIDRLLDHCRNEAATNPLMRFEEVEPRDARALLQRCLDHTNETPDATVDDSFGSYHAFVRHRVRALPTGGRVPQPAVHGADRRADLAVRFLASDEAGGLSDTAAASRCVDRIIDYGCTHDFGRPLRVSPVKCEMFLLDWLPRKVLLSQAEQEAVPHVLAAWVRWAGHRTGLPDAAIRATLDAVWDATAKFPDAYRDPSSFGLDRDIVDRLLPDGDLEALPRRAFAMPFLSGRHRVSGRHGTIDLSVLDPSDPADRRILLELEHPGAPEEHLEAHERLAERLWQGDPPQLWETAQALLDVGYERHEVMHRLIAVMDRSGHDPRAFRASLHVLRHEPPPG